MLFDPPLQTGVLLQRYKRFLADIRLDNGETITAHCPNPGAMHACSTPGWRVAVSHNPDPKRKLPYTFEMIHNGNCWIGVNTMRTNPLVKEALEEGIIQELQGYTDLRSEVKYGEKSRIDFLLSHPGTCYLEVKNVSYIEGQTYMFPDGITTRGARHMQELLAMVTAGHRAAVLFVVQRSDGSHFRPAAHIDAAYAQVLQMAHQGGVEVLVYEAQVSPNESRIIRPLPWQLDAGDNPSEKT